MDSSIIYYGLTIVLTFFVGLTVYRTKRNTRLLREFYSRFKPLLQSESSYFQQLDQKAQFRFLKRVMRFIHHKKFIPRNLEAVTDEMKVLIAACATQLTFGLPENRLRYFDKIIVYPDAYYSILNRSYHKGEVNPGMGAIVLSWKSFREGFSQPHDSVNLGLHEMAHALSLAHKYSGKSILDERVYKRWKAHALWHLKQTNAAGKSIFRAYGHLNTEEFFAVAVEHFFERPAEFKKKETQLYQILVKLLQQDPLYIRQKSQSPLPTS